MLLRCLVTGGCFGRRDLEDAGHRDSFKVYSSRFCLRVQVWSTAHGFSHGVGVSLVSKCDAPTMTGPTVTSTFSRRASVVLMCMATGRRFGAVSQGCSREQVPILVPCGAVTGRRNLHRDLHSEHRFKEDSDILQRSHCLQTSLEYALGQCAALA